MQESVKNFKPSFLWFTLIRTLPLILLFTLGSALVWALSGDFKSDVWFGSVFNFTVLFIVLSLVSYLLLKPRLSVTVSRHTIRGPFQGQRITLPLKQLDLAQSRNETVRQGLIGNYHIQTTTGERIQLDKTYYSKAQYSRILDVLESSMAQGSVVQGTKDSSVTA